MNGADDQGRPGAFDGHLSECEECRTNRVAIAMVARVLSESTMPPIDGAVLSRRVLAAVRPELARRARFMDWPRLAAAVLGSLIPLPLVLTGNALFLVLVHTVLTAIGLPVVATYAVASYAAGLVFVLGATYAAIPVLVERSAGPRAIALS
jgi:predicted anti-sigma-YlaC factor YlaD